MRFVLIACALGAIAAHALTAEDLTGIRETFEAWKQEHGRLYGTPELDNYRFSVFAENVERIRKLNDAELGNPEGAVFTINKFADLTPEEFAQQYLNFVPKEGQAAIDRMNAPARRGLKPTTATEIDWRLKGAVTPVKDQGRCGSCWAFSAIAQLESTYFLAGNPLTALSEQQVVSCDNKGFNMGCNGGDTITAYDYTDKAGVQSEKSYPYTSGTTGRDGTCFYNATDVVVFTNGYYYATPPCFDACNNQDENTLLQSLMETPISVCVYASTWQFYSGGVMTGNCPNAYRQLNHCVQLVGAGDTPDGMPYWNMRNSWGTGWGEQGHIRTRRGTNLCGVADEAVVPFLRK